VQVTGCTPNPTAQWSIQQARQVTWTLVERAEPIRFLIRDRDQKFTDGFDEVFRSDGIEIVREPVDRRGQGLSGADAGQAWPSRPSPAAFHFVRRRPCGVAPYAPIVHQAQHQIDVCAALLNVVDELLKGVELDVGLDDLEPKAMAA